MYQLNSDGGARGNPGPGACAFVLRSENGEIAKTGGEYLGASVTNNFAEYKGLILGLDYCISQDIKTLHCFLDSELVVKQLLGEYRVKDVHLKDLHSHVLALGKRFSFLEFSYVPRTKNKEADKLVNQILDEKKRK